jgi:hypothetical protein
VIPGSWTRGAREGAHPGCGRPARGDRERGQATVELALVLPVIVMLLCMLFQIALVARDQVLVVHAARAAVREASVDAGEDRVRGAATHTLRGAEVEVHRGAAIGDPVTVDVTYVSKTDLPLVGALVPDVTLHATSTMRRER